MKTCAEINRAIRILWWLSFAVHLIVVLGFFAITGLTHGVVYGAALATHIVVTTAVVIVGKVAMDRADR